MRKTTYEASGGVEIFLEAVGPDDTLYGILRLRIPHKPRRPELSGKTALVRELHVYGPAVPVGEPGYWWQHAGIGRRLMAAAEEEAARQGARRVAVISGVGVREYYRKLGYTRCGPYMCKEVEKTLLDAEDQLIAY